MYKKVFIDANIFIDTNDNRRALHQQSLSVIHHLVSSGISIYTSCDLVTTIYYILSKKDKMNALDSIENLSAFCTIIEFSNHEVLQTCKLMKEDSNYHDLEDSLQYILAKKEGCDLILSNDKNFYALDIEVLSSEEFLELVKIGSVFTSKIY